MLNIKQKKYMKTNEFGFFFLKNYIAITKTRIKIRMKENGNKNGYPCFKGFKNKSFKNRKKNSKM